VQWALATSMQQTEWQIAIGRLPLNDALVQLARQADVAIARFSDVEAERIVVGPLSGRFSRDEALRLLLRGTGLTYRFVNDHTVAIMREPKPAAEAPDAPLAQAVSPSPNQVGATAPGAINSGGNSVSIKPDKPRRRSLWSRFVCLIAVCGAASLQPNTSALGAQASPSDAAAPDVAAPPVAGQLQQITVTAERVSENIQSVPITVNAVTGAQLAQRGVVNLQSLSTTVPSVVNYGNTTNFTYIRGIGSQNNSLNNEAAVANYIDGVYMPSPYDGFGNFNQFDIQRIEVLKGPQGTLFGRDTTGGVIQVITPNPKQALSSDWSLSYGNYDTVAAEGYMTGGVTHDLSANLAVNYQDQMHGWGTDVCPNVQANVCSPAQATGLSNSLGARSKWLWTPWDATNVIVEGDYERFRANNAMQMVPGSSDSFDKSLPPGFPVPVSSYLGRYNDVGVPYLLDAKQSGASLHIDHDFSDGLRFVSITSYRQVNANDLHDNTRTADNALYTIAQASHGIYKTQEFQLIDNKPGRVTWLLGGYYFGDSVGYDPRTNVGSKVAGGFQNVFGNQTIKSYSAYGRETTELFDQTKLDLSVRYTAESVGENGYYQNAAGRLVTPSNSLTGAAVFRSSLKYNPWTYRAALDHQFSQDVMGYVSFTHGFKSGGFNLPNPEKPAFLPETIDSYEAGLKSELLDHRLRVNLSAYYYNYRNIQVVIVPGLSGQVFTNAAAAHADGLDADFAFAATDRLQLFAGFGYLHGYYTNYPDAQRYTPAGVAVTIPNAAGFPLPYAPRYSGNVGFNATMPTSIGSFTFVPTVAYTDSFPFQTDPYFLIRRTVMVNAQVEWESPTVNGLAVRLWGRNLANEYTYGSTSVESSGGWYAIASPPRTYGVMILMSF
jgi:iron complex outermembrane receptor protein